MSEPGTTCPSVDWDAGVGMLTIRADGLAPRAQRATVTFHSRIWISLDDHAEPTAVDILDVPEIMARVVPRARRARDGEPAARPGIPWLLDPESDWAWIQLDGGPDRSRLVREGRVEVWLTGELPVRVRLWVPVSGTADRVDGRPR
ncbi:hypothetical protein [Streptomyces akebiae]|uniref:Uncharacterized protein n=1 Tax=Streptomyces akebiae TaxID=2865673 RepID=A0ABX8XUH2_9ACTN|nr:hypothetical protein [Streptomyces akebiae]QYX79576.1 hypothetical protein K1J60_26390 [Streptomyces akebiae]